MRQLTSLKTEVTQLARTHPFPLEPAIEGVGSLPAPRSRQREDCVQGEWWIANPSDESDGYGPPERADRISGALREVAGGEFALETIGFLNQASTSSDNESGSEGSSDRSHIWGSGRNERCVSLLNCFRVNRTMGFPSIAGGYEDWAVGWLAKGDAWVTPDAQSSSAWLATDDLRAWALYDRPDNTVSLDANNTATIDFQDEALGRVSIGDISVSLIRSPKRSYQNRWETDDRLLSVNNTVSLKLEGPLALRDIAEEWASCIERFVRFMSMSPSVVSGAECRLADSGDQPQFVELALRRLPRNVVPTSRDTQGRVRPQEFLTTWESLTKQGCDPMQVFARFVSEAQRGDAYVAMISHLESQDRLLSRGADGALLNGVRSVEAQYVFENPGVDDRSKGVQAKINDAAHQAGDVGKQTRGAWSAFDDINDLRIQVAHGKSRPGADFGLRCLGGAWSLQWIQRFHLLRVLGITESVAETLICENPRFDRDLGSLRMWSNEL